MGSCGRLWTGAWEGKAAGAAQLYAQCRPVTSYAAPWCEPAHPHGPQDQPPTSVVEAAAQHLHRSLLQALRPVGTAAAAAYEGEERGAARWGRRCQTDAAASDTTVGSGAGAAGAEVSEAAEPEAGADAEEEAARGVAAALRGAAVVEWWAHTRVLGAAHQLHFDVNEDVLRRVGCVDGWCWRVMRVGGRVGGHVGDVGGWTGG